MTLQRGVKGQHLHTWRSGVAMQQLLLRCRPRLSRLWLRLHRLLRNDYALLARFLVPLAFTTVVADIGEQASLLSLECKLVNSPYTRSRVHYNHVLESP